MAESDAAVPVIDFARWRPHELALWLGEAIDCHYDVKFSAFLPISLRGQLIAVVGYSNFYPHMMDISIATTSPRWATKHTLRMIFTYPFVRLGVRRLNAQCARRNKKARDLVERVGFVYECVAVDAWQAGGDAVLYRMLKRDCRWI